MTNSTWRIEILKVCKSCNDFIDNGKSRGRYKCKKSGLSVYDSHDCLKTFEVRKEAAAVSKRAVDLAYEALTTGWGE
ncbi:hypothetical protein AGMMS50268_09280 [Spirochaetia bacterium]|nr:hypothetical protein AGMMS50268_09280 [Spirochaetia bacterium]